MHDLVHDPHLRPVFPFRTYDRGLGYAIFRGRMKTPASRRRLRAAAFLSPLFVVAALLAPASALAAAPTVRTIGPAPTPSIGQVPTTFTRQRRRDSGR